MNFRRKCIIIIAILALIMLALPTVLTVEEQKDINSTAVNFSSNITVALNAQNADKPEVGVEALFAIAGLLAVAFLLLRQQK